MTSFSTAIFDTASCNDIRILIIGSGRLAKHLNHWLALLNDRRLKITNWSRSQNSIQDLENKLKQTDFVWLCLSDSALENFYREHLHQYPQLRVVHFSGALEIPGTISTHPLMTFSDVMYDLDFYQKIPFAMTGVETLEEALPFTKNPRFHLSAESKPLYHALCVVAGNFPQLLLTEVQNLADQNKIPFSAFKLFVEKSVENYFEAGPAGMSGPFVRQDKSTLQKNFDALDKTPLQNIYSAFQKEYLK